MEMLTTEQIETFLRDGVLVVDNFISNDEVQRAHQGLSETLAKFGVDIVHNLSATAARLAALSSTNGSGGVLDLFYDEWKMNIALHPKLFAWTQQLWQAGYCQHGERLEDLDDNDAYDYRFMWHPYGPFDKKDQAFAYIDRICYRLPSALSDEIGFRMGSSMTTTTTNKKKSKKKQSLQRSLTPHLDCCPTTFDDPTHKSKWRPIQCFVSLTDNEEPNTGGFEVAKGFHREFREWSKHRPPTVIMVGSQQQKQITVHNPPACIGEYTHIRPKEDANVMQRVQHVPVRAGSVVFWDNRLPHANAYRHEGTIPRVVVYCSFLPPIPLNRRYAERQLAQWRRGQTPTDQWIHPVTADCHGASEPAEEMAAHLPDYVKKLTKLQRQLLTLDEW